MQITYIHALPANNFRQTSSSWKFSEMKTGLVDKNFHLLITLTTVHHVILADNWCVGCAHQTENEQFLSRKFVIK